MGNHAGWIDMPILTQLRDFDSGKFVRVRRGLLRSACRVFFGNPPLPVEGSLKTVAGVSDPSYSTKMRSSLKTVYHVLT